MEAIGTAGAIIGVLDVVARSLLKLAEIRKRYKEVSLTVELLSGRLVTVRAALEQIHRFVDDALRGREQHHQLVIDLGTAIHCCSLLVQVLDDTLALLVYDDGDGLTRESRLRMTLQSQGIDECMVRLDHQVNALNLVITAFQCRSLAQQATTLTTSAAEEAFQQIKDDSTSLIVLRDGASFETRRTRTTTATSKLSLDFAFDAELLQHKAYRSTFKSLIRRGGNRQRKAADVKEQFAVSDQARWIKTFLENDSLTAISELRLDELEMLAVVGDADILLNALGSVGCLIFEDKKRLARERMIHWAITYLALHYFRIFNGQAVTQSAGSEAAPEFGAVVMQLADSLNDMYSRPGSLHSKSIAAARWLLPRIDGHRLAAQLPDGARAFEDIKRFLNVDFDPSEEEASAFDRHTPEIYPYRHTSIYFENSILRLVMVEPSSTDQATWPHVRCFAYRPVDCLILEINMLDHTWFTSKYIIPWHWEDLLDSLQQSLDVKDAETKRNRRALKSTRNYGVIADVLITSRIPHERFKFGPLDPNSDSGLRQLRRALISILDDEIGRKRRHEQSRRNRDGRR